MTCSRKLSLDSELEIINLSKISHRTKVEIIYVKIKKLTRIEQRRARSPLLEKERRWLSSNPKSDANLTKPGFYQKPGFKAPMVSQEI